MSWQAHPLTLWSSMKVLMLLHLNVNQDQLQYVWRELEMLWILHKMISVSVCERKGETGRKRKRPICSDWKWHRFTWNPWIAKAHKIISTNHFMYEPWTNAMKSPMRIKDWIGLLSNYNKHGKKIFTLIQSHSRCTEDAGTTRLFLWAVTWKSFQKQLNWLLEVLMWF